LPPVSTLPPDADDSIAQAVVDGVGYDVCDLADIDGFATGLVGEINPDATAATTMRELGAAYGHDPRGDAYEGAVACEVSGRPPNQNSSSPNLKLRVWTDDQLRFALGDPGVTAAARAGVLRQRLDAQGSSFTGPAADLAGVGEGGWWSVDFSTIRVFAWQGSFLLGVDLRSSPSVSCSGDQAQVTACEAAAAQPLLDAFTTFFPAAVAQLQSGTGRTAKLPPPKSVDDVRTVSTAAGPVDLCAVLTTAVAATFAGIPFDAAVADDTTAQLGDRPIEGGHECQVRPRDAETAPTVTVKAFGTDIAEAAELFAERHTKYESEPVAGIGDEAYLVFIEIIALDGNVYFTVSLADADGSSAGTDERIAHTQSIAAGVAANL
jgi:hypothetical protein